MKKVPFFGTSARLHEVRYAVHTLETIDYEAWIMTEDCTRLTFRPQVIREEFGEDLLSM